MRGRAVMQNRGLIPDSEKSKARWKPETTALAARETCTFTSLNDEARLKFEVVHKTALVGAFISESNSKRDTVDPCVTNNIILFIHSSLCTCEHIQNRDESGLETH